MLQQIRTKAFSPDATRSGMLSSAIVPDPKSFFQVDFAPNPKASEEADEESRSSETSSDSEASDGTDHELAADSQQDPVIAPKAWDSDVVMYRNLRTQVVHVVAGGCVDSLLCGVKITQDFEQVAESPFLDIRKCKRCAAKKPINTVGYLAAALGASKR